MAVYYSWQWILENLLWSPVLTTCLASILLALFVMFFRSNTGKFKSLVRLDGKTVIITGSSAGIGEAAAYDIASRGAKLILACRNIKKGNIVKDNIIKKTQNSEITVKELDVSLLGSVRRFAEDVISTEDRLDILIHNAGVIIPENPTTEENLNSIWATNYIGPFLLTHLLIDLMRKTKNSRMIFVSSTAHSSGVIKQEQSDFLRNCKSDKTGFKDCFWSYCDTKLAQMLFTKELARRLPTEEVTVNALHPGLVNTSILANSRKPLIETIIYKLVGLILFFFIKTPEEGAQTTIYLAVSEELVGVSGKYFSDCEEKPASEKTDDQYLAKKLWNFSEDIVGISTQQNTGSHSELRL